MSNTIDWGKIHYNSWSPETNLTGAGATPSFSNTKSIAQKIEFGILRERSDRSSVPELINNTFDSLTNIRNEYKYKK